ncbi:MAG: hypothetical protein RL095_3614 [Verrucomicrobiota bacterium]|jgi:hypothetical protein
MKSLLICSSLTSLAAASGLAFWAATWEYKKDSSIQVAAANASPPAPYFQASPALESQAIAERPLWRDDRRPAPEKTDDPEDLEPMAPVNLELVAIAGGEDGHGFALIAQSSSPSKDSRRRSEGEAPISRSRSPGVLYAVGDEIPGTGLKIAAISSDTVKLSGSKPQELKIEWTSIAAKARLETAFKEASSRKSESNILGAQSKTGGGAISSGGNQDQEKFGGYTKDELMNLRQQDPEKFRQVIKELHKSSAAENNPATPAEGDKTENGGENRGGNRGRGDKGRDR